MISFFFKYKLYFKFLKRPHVPSKLVIYIYIWILLIFFKSIRLLNHFTKNFMKTKTLNFDRKFGTVRNYQWPHIDGWAVVYRNVINNFLIPPKTSDSRSSIMQSKNLRLVQWGCCLSLMNESKSSLLGLLPLINEVG